MSLASRILRRVLDPTRRRDYLFAALIGLVPVVFALATGAGPARVVDRSTFFIDGEDRFNPRLSDCSKGPDAACVGTCVEDMCLIDEVVIGGYWNSPNFLALIVLLPLILLVVRRVMAAMAPVDAPWPPPQVPPVVHLAHPDAHPETYAALRSALLSPKIWYAALIGTCVFQVVDLWATMSTYLGGKTDTDLDFTLLFMAGEQGISKASNLALIVFAFTPQVLCVLLSALIGIWLLVHNVFFLSRVYQRHRATSGRWKPYFVIDLDDPDRCFGFRRANAAFNVQVMALVFCGAVLLVTRVVHALRAEMYGQLPESLGDLEVGHFIQDVGQFFVPFNWGLALCVVFLPALVKVLPFLPGIGSSEAKRDLKTYLQAYLPPQLWALDGAVHPEDMDDLAARFCANSFWPTGDNRAAWLFTFAYLVFGVTALTPLLTTAWGVGTLAFLGVIIGLVLFSVGFMKLTLLVLNRVLFYVDRRLVVLPPGGVKSGPPALFRAPREGGSRDRTPVADDSPRIVLEFSRAHAGDDPHAFDWSMREYQRRLGPALVETGTIAWEGDIQHDLVEILGTGSSANARARMAESLRRFLLDVGWAADEKTLLDGNGSAGVQITFVSAAAELYALPWELTAVGPAGHTLGSMPGVHLRYEWPGSVTPESKPLLAGRVLFAWSAAGGPVPSSVQARQIAAAAGASDTFDLETDVVANASTRSIVAALKAGIADGRPYTVLHLLAHGVPLPEDAQSVGVALNDQLGGADVVASIDLKAQLAPFADSLQMVFLCTCMGATGQVGAHLGSLAQELHRGGIRAVIAARTPLSVDGANTLTDALYSGLLGPEHLCLEVALDRARGQLRESDLVADALCVQHYGRAADGPQTFPIGADR